MFTKRTYSIRGFAGDIIRLTKDLRPLAEAYAAKDFDPKLREKAWLAVSTVNDCRYCLFVHGTWAESVGVSVEEIAAMAGADPGQVDSADGVAQVYLQAWAERDFKDVPEGIAAVFHSEFSDRDQVRLQAIARYANLSNRTGNTFDALLARLRGERAQDSALVDELAVSAVFLAAAAVVTPVLAMAKRKSPLALLQELLSRDAIEDRSGGARRRRGHRRPGSGGRRSS